MFKRHRHSRFLAGIAILCLLVVLLLFALKITQTFVLREQKAVYFHADNKVLLGTDRDTIANSRPTMKDETLKLYQFYEPYTFVEALGVGVSDRVDDSSFWRAVSFTILFCFLFLSYKNLPETLKASLESRPMASRYDYLILLGIIVFYVIVYFLKLKGDHGQMHGTLLSSREINGVWQIQYIEGCLYIASIVLFYFPVLFSYRFAATTTPKLQLSSDVVSSINGLLTAAIIPPIICIVGYWGTLCLLKEGLSGTDIAIMAKRKFLPTALAYSLWFLPYIVIAGIVIVKCPRTWRIRFAWKNYLLPEITKLT